MTAVAVRRVDARREEVEVVCAVRRAGSARPIVAEAARAVEAAAGVNIAAAHKVKGRGSYIIIARYWIVSQAISLDIDAKIFYPKIF